MAYLDGDALSDRVEVIPNQGFTQLVVSYGDQRSSVIPIGSGDSIALLKLSSGDFTGGGESDLIALTSDPVSGTYSITIISSPAGEYTVYTMPDAATDAHYRFQAEFTRGYVLELSSQAYDFVLSVQIGADETRAVYKDDGTVPATLRASVSGFNDYTLTMYNDRLAMDLWQTVSSTAQEQPLGFIVSTMVWQDGAPRLTAQRYVAN
ncbi:hypothetical protein AGMMS49992_00720 [Clostridia bacterium]|nr:hypothetical protein AGMMS49992_00720 [Clostridia bacterium]